jgi:NAD(P)-dependent dehydrogenase (short-subunit alcohol dehydrogenase family)
LVTGASSGIGRAIALGLARQGAGLCLVGRDRGRLEGAANEAGAPALFYQVDLAEEGAIERLARDVARGPGGVDVLVLAHGLFASGTSESVPVSELDALYRTNVRAAYLLAQSFLASLAERQGQIVFVNSSVVAGARGGVGQYAASKLALKGLADSLRDEVNPRGIRVLSVYPGRTATPMQAAIFEAEGRTWEPERLLQPEDVAQIVIAALLLPRTAEVTEIYVRPMNKV